MGCLSGLISKRNCYFALPLFPSSLWVYHVMVWTYFSICLFCGCQGHITCVKDFKDTSVLIWNMEKTVWYFLWFPVCMSFQGHATVLLVAMFVFALGYIISTLVLFGIISTLIVEFWYDQIIMKFRHVSRVNTVNLFVFSWLLQAFRKMLPVQCLSQVCLWYANNGW
jgi:hypothetical protein